MPAGLALVSPFGVLDQSRPNIRAACAAARSSIRRSGFCLAECWAAAVACRRGGEHGSYNRAHAAAWFRAAAVAASVGWPGNRAPAGLSLVLATWSPGRVADRLPVAQQVRA